MWPNQVLRCLTQETEEKHRRPRFKRSRDPRPRCHLLPGSPLRPLPLLLLFPLPGPGERHRRRRAGGLVVRIRRSPDSLSRKKNPRRSTSWPTARTKTSSPAPPAAVAATGRAAVPRAGRAATRAGSPRRTGAATTTAWNRSRGGPCRGRARTAARVSVKSRSGFLWRSLMLVRWHVSC